MGWAAGNEQATSAKSVGIWLAHFCPQGWKHIGLVGICQQSEPLALLFGATIAKKESINRERKT